MSKKYEFTGETKEFNGRILRRIRRIEDDLVGGWIESEENLSQEGNCFVYDNAMVYGDAEVFDNARIFDNARVYENARVCDNARVYENARVCGDTRVCGYATICNNAEVRGGARIFGYARVCGDTRVCGYATICNNAEVRGDVEVRGDARIFGYARVCGDATIYDGRIIGQISQSYEDIFQYQCKRRMLTAILTKDNEILYTIGCQEDITKEQFLDRIYNTGGGLENNPHREEYLKLIPLIESYFGN